MFSLARFKNSDYSKIMIKLRITCSSDSIYEIKKSNTSPSLDLFVKKGDGLLKIIRQGSFPHFNAPCGGRGTCGKCRIRLLSGELSTPSAEELSILTEQELLAGIRLACRARIAYSETPVHILISENSGGIRIKTGFQLPKMDISRFRLRSLDLSPGTLDDQRSLLERMEQGGKTPPIRILKKLAELCSDTEKPDTGKYRLLTDSGRSLDLVGEEENVLGIGVDIGTTTIAAHLINLITGEIVETWSGLNSQSAYGADVISRIEYGSRSGQCLETLHNTITGQLDNAFNHLIDDAAAINSHVKIISIAGNTTMLHLLLGVNPAGIAKAPFIPVFTRGLTISAVEAGFPSFSHAEVELLPSISAYVGADITAGIGVSELDSSDSPILFLDIGTNGEMALACEGSILCCSTAAGPAFEGANISRGTGGIPGAVDKIEISDNRINCSTIDNREAVGICGSGIIDAAALLIRTGKADYTGFIQTAEEAGVPWIIDTDDGSAFRITEGNNSTESGEILFTQKDLREVQLAKAAIAGGIRTLLKMRNLSFGDIGKVILAGGFGSYIDPRNAGAIGLLPGSLWKKTIPAGNTSSAGAVQQIREKEAAKEFLNIAETCNYLELSANPDFQNYYIEELCFPEDEN